MSEDYDNYRPRSPDLSGFGNPPALERISSHPVTSNPSNFPTNYDFSPRRSYDASPYFSPQTTQPNSYFGNLSTTPGPQPFSPSNFRSPSTSWANQGQIPGSIYPQSQFQHPITNQPPTDYVPQVKAPQGRFPIPQHQSNFPAPGYSVPPTTSFQYQQSPSHNLPLLSSEMPTTRSRKQPGDIDTTYDPNGSAPGRTPVVPSLSGAAAPTMMQYQAPPPVPTGDSWRGIDVKTKFPVARIKRIMQADEDVGKVAQATPTAVAKALELFMMTLVTKGAAEAAANGSKRVTAQHLKAALMKDGQYDFLTEICESVPDEGTKKGRSKSEAKSEESDEGDIVGTKKKGGKGGKKRKAGSDDESD